GVFDFAGFAQKPKTNQFSLIDFLFDIKNKEIINANVNVAEINNRLVALTEIPLPVEFDKNLNTLGFFDYADSLTKNYSFESAHILKDPDTQASWNFLIEIGLLDTAYQIYKIPHLSSERQLVASIPVSAISYMHSFCLAGRYLILIDYPLRAQNPKDIANGFIEAFAWSDKNPAVVYLIDKESGKCQPFLTDPFFAFHYVNGFEKDGKVFVDLIAYPNAEIIYKVNYYPFLKNAGNKLLRLEMDPLKNTIKVTQQTQEHVEFPRLNEFFIGKNYHYFYAIHNRKGGNGLIKYDHLKGKHLHWFQEGTYANEPIFIPHPQAEDEDEGVILSIINDLETKKSFLVILNAKDFKELARVSTPHLIPFGFHGQFFKTQ
ncbi:MAG: carotenoid oxygenase family protein, partial [Proteobacteria bacterium]|nr:carotenoid oxygenase family protein [Pseudomonadota bacterium]